MLVCLDSKLSQPLLKKKIHVDLDPNDVHPTTATIETTTTTPISSTTVEKTVTEEPPLRQRKTTSVVVEPKDATSVPKAKRIGGTPIDEVKKFASEAVQYGKNPERFIPQIKEVLHSNFPHRVPLIFAFIWLPFVLMAGGSIIGSLIGLVIRNTHFLAGIAAGIYVWTIHQSNAASSGTKFLNVYLISSLLPIFMIHEPYLIFQVAALLAFAGTPFLLNQYFLDSPKNPKKTDDTTPVEENSEEVLLSFSTVPSVIFIIATGGFSYWHDFFVAPIFAVAAFGALRAFPIVLSKLDLVPVAYRPLALANKPILFGLVETIIAHVLLFLARMTVFPQSVVNEQNPFYGIVLITILGFIIFAAGNALHGAKDVLATQFKLPLNTLNLAQKGFDGAVLVSFVALLAEHVIKYWLTGTH